ncbi:hybrid sensor histidine kinase/response regulator [Maribellus maritimus]|uniref:hybrid sensor histidine kinase/response regulator n=1 Tax=Maribellus maritimus TaxID=2870838 RepID=UPI001EEBDCF2|nr:hybrid sensor histidine kinase/response regulator [Maribellus maritimus]MCG6190262.1 hybrid sensor histidine kinase/response regulator [Maribellus maritimus]
MIMDNPIYILVVDDNLENLKVVSNFLKEEDYKIALAIDGESALEVLRNTQIDLILLDVMMPGKDGFEVCEEIKSDKELAEIPVIFLTAKTAPEDIIKGFKTGAIDYLTKPFIRDELLIRVKTHLEHNKSKKKLLETIKTRDKLFSIIAHDIRAPFSSISMLISLLNLDEEENSGDTKKRVMPLLERTAKDTTILLDNLLEWTRLQTDTITLKPQYLDVSTIIKDCINLLKGNAKAKNIVIELKLEKEIIAFFDEVTMHTVFRNLISNAIKFTPDKGLIIINVRDEGNYASIGVTDSGVGMSDELQRKIFEDDNIYTSQGTNQEKGSGLGLKIVKDMVAQNKGLISVKSEINLGTQIVVRIPTGRL